jgi:hypothetical protein
MTHLDEETAYAAMIVFIEAYWERGGKQSEDLAALLGDLHGDPAQPSDWADAVGKVTGGGAPPTG